MCMLLYDMREVHDPYISVLLTIIVVYTHICTRIHVAVVRDRIA
jgi:hypothetical protein